MGIVVNLVHGMGAKSTPAEIFLIVSKNAGG